MLPLLKQGQDPRVVSVASSGVLKQQSPTIQERFSSPDLTMPKLLEMVKEFETSVVDGTHKDKGWGASPYGVSKLAVLAATQIWARNNNNNEPSSAAAASATTDCIKFFACCPGFCKTDLMGLRDMAVRDAEDGARNAVLPATLPTEQLPPSGSFFSDYEVATWS
jgi:NAD(P)-dependent dehydrogenase (short-subunit alcohol dehydrogenase family)